MKQLIILAIYTTILMAGMAALSWYEFSRLSTSVDSLSIQVWEAQQQISNQIAEER